RLWRPSLDLWTSPLESRCLHQDRGDRIPQIVGHDAEHLIAALRCLDRSAIEACVLDGHGGSVSQRFSPTKIVLSVNAIRVRGAEQQHAQGLPRTSRGTPMTDV